MSFRVVFMGTPAFAVPSLDALVNAGHNVVAAVCQPDAPVGRKREPVPPPVKMRADELGIPVYQPKGLRTAKPQDRLREFAPELIVVTAYGKILPPAVLEMPPRSCINVHGSLLPALRGAAPIQWAIARGLRTTGVTTMLMDEGMDTGPMLLQREMAIGDRETGQELSERMATVGAELLVETLRLWEARAIEPRPQPGDGVSLAPLLRKEDGYMDWTGDASELDCRIRAFFPWPGAVCTSPDGRILKVLRAKRVPGDSGTPGAVLGLPPEGIVVAAGTGALLLETVQPESRRSMSASEFARGLRLSIGDVLGQLPRLDSNTAVPATET